MNTKTIYKQLEKTFAWLSLFGNSKIRKNGNRNGNLSQITFTLSSLVSHYNRKSMLLTEVTDECIAQSFHCWQTPFPSPHVTAAAHAPVLRCLHVKLNFYTNRERARASCIDPQPPPQAFAPAAEKWKDHRIQEESGISILYAVCCL